MNAAGVDDNGTVYQTPEELWERAGNGGASDLPQVVLACLLAACVLASRPACPHRRHELLCSGTKRQWSIGTSKKLATMACWEAMATCPPLMCGTAARSCAR